MSSSTTTTPPSKPKSSTTTTWLLATVLLPILAATLLYRLDSFSPSVLPLHLIPYPLLTPPVQNGHLLDGVELIGRDKLPSPEDLVYDQETGFIYTGCADGWLKRISVGDTVEETVVEDLVHTGGRPLGLAKGLYGNLIVADVHKGLLNVTADGKVEVLSSEAEGIPFGLTDAVDVAKDGMIYFTDATYKYKFIEHMLDIFEGKPHGRLLSYNPFTKVTEVLVRDLYFANGVAVSPDQSHLIFCETVMQRCLKYHLEGSKTGTVVNFVDGLPGGPDNIHYNHGDGHYSIGLSTGTSHMWNILLKYPSFRKIMAMFHKSTGLPDLGREAGAIIIDKEGHPITYYHDDKLSMSSSAITVGEHLYLGNVVYPGILRLNTTKYPAT